MVLQTSTYTVVPVVQSDLRTVLGMWSDLTRYLHQQSHQPFGELTPPRFVMLEDVLKRTFANEKAAIFKALDGAGSMMGTIAVVLNEQLGFSQSESGIIFNLWVSPELRQLGVGTALVAKAKSWLAEQGAASVQVGWNPGNGPADRFWTKQGFKAFELLASSPI